ncbi:MAG: hypothetical protein F4Z31_04445 [Gemmatimonadetes bacterium]|nr:hypothetical protein [Gemmatimonadota bacterium]MYJ10496.1 hypothetical protein [Gemmatimonadota bacterium]
MTWSQEHRRAAHAANAKRQRDHDELCRGVIEECRTARFGPTQIAARLNELGIPTPGAALTGHSGTTWTPTMAKRIHDRLFARCRETGDLFDEMG